MAAKFGKYQLSVAGCAPDIAVCGCLVIDSEVQGDTNAALAGW
jgi:hypothetical protein